MFFITFVDMLYIYIRIDSSFFEEKRNYYLYFSHNPHTSYYEFDRIKKKKK